MARVRSTETLRRYTDLPALLYMLNHRCITLLDPTTWDDTNDSYYLLKYKEKRKLATVLALCLTRADETHHHWRIFSHGPAGVCIDFHRTDLIAALEGVAGVTVKDLEYRKVRVERRQVAAPKISELPFLKRHGFVAEEEVRAVYESVSKAAKFLDVKIELSSIRRITLSPWLNVTVQVDRSGGAVVMLRSWRSSMRMPTTALRIAQTLRLVFETIGFRTVRPVMSLL